MKTTRYYKTIDEIIDGAKCPLPIDVIPNRMGINLRCVRGIEWFRRDDSQLKTITIHFIPNEEGDPRITNETEVFSRPECIFNYCPHAEDCKEKCINKHN